MRQNMRRMGRLAALAVFLLALGGLGCGSDAATSDGADGAARDASIDGRREAGRDVRGVDADGAADETVDGPAPDAVPDTPAPDAGDGSADTTADGATADTTADGSAADSTVDGAIADSTVDGATADTTADTTADAATADSTADGASADATADGATADSTADGASADTTADAASADTTADAASSDSTALVDGGCGGSGVATIGPAGGTLWSSDCAARLVVPAGALTSTQVLTMSRSTSAPIGAVAPGYDIGPNGLILNQPGTLTLGYAPSALLGATEQALVAGVVANSLWDPLANSTVSTNTRSVSAPLSTLSTVGVLPGDATGPVANVLVLASAATATRFVAESGGETPVVGVAINASSFPLAGRSMSYTSSKPTVASINATTGDLVGGKLTQANTAEAVTVTAVDGAAGVSGTASVLVLPVSSADVVERGTFGVVDDNGALGALVTVTYLQNPTINFFVNNGSYTQEPALPAGSVYTLSFSSAGYLSTLHTWWSQITSTTGAQRDYLLLKAAQLSVVACGTPVDLTTKGAVSVPRPPATPAVGWTYFVSDLSAVMRYTGPSYSAACTATSTTSTGAGVALNVSPGVHWVVAKRGTQVYAVIVDVKAGALAQAVFPALASKDGTTIF